MTGSRDTSGSGEDSSEGTQSKVERVIAKYDLGGIDDELADAWMGEGDEHSSLRELATYFNRRVLRAAMTNAGMDPLDGEIENYHRLLTDEDISQGTLVEARKRLEQQGIDVEELTGDFVSYQSINRHLKGSLGVEYSAEELDRVKTAADSIASLQNRTVAVTEKSLRQLRDSGDLTLGDFDVFVDITATCTDCGETTTVRELLAEDGCRCTAL